MGWTPEMGEGWLDDGKTLASMLREWERPEGSMKPQEWKTPRGKAGFLEWLEESTPWGEPKIPEWRYLSWGVKPTDCPPMDT